MHHLQYSIQLPEYVPLNREVNRSRIWVWSRKPSPWTSRTWPIDGPPRTSQSQLEPKDPAMESSIFWRLGPVPFSAHQATDRLGLLSAELQGTASHGDHTRRASFRADRAVLPGVKSQSTSSWCIDIKRKTQINSHFYHCLHILRGLIIPPPKKQQFCNGQEYNSSRKLGIAPYLLKEAGGFLHEKWSRRHFIW